MDLEGLLSRVALAFGIGLLIGLERGWRTREALPGSRAAGLRTFAISGLLGGLVGALAQGANGTLGISGSILLGLAFLAFAVVITMFSRDENRASGTSSATTAIAALLTFILGAYALVGDVRVAAASAVTAVAVLVFREGLHGWVASITRVEFESALVLLAMTFIALPIVPDRSVGPFGGVNLREVWVIAVAIASISFAGYIAVKHLGERRGALVAAAAGGLVSSTAVALANARRAAAGEGSARTLAAGTALATAVSFVRVAAIVGALKPSLLMWVGPSLLVGALVAAGFALVSLLSARGDPQSPVPFRNPFGFWPVIGIAASMGALIVVGRVINERFGATGAIAGAATMGLFDVDAMTVSMVRLESELASRAASFAILAGVASNTLSKVALSAVIGRGRFAVEIAAVALGCIIAGWIALVITLAVAGQ
ncbi:MAG: DUF4010 domain-containing protein [Gammaproteobacteria bacterium]